MSYCLPRFYNINYIFSMLSQIYSIPFYSNSNTRLSRNYLQLFSSLNGGVCGECGRGQVDWRRRGGFGGGGDVPIYRLLLVLIMRNGSRDIPLTDRMRLMKPCVLANTMHSQDGLYSAMVLLILFGSKL